MSNEVKASDTELLRRARKYMDDRSSGKSCIETARHYNQFIWTAEYIAARENEIVKVMADFAASETAALEAKVEQFIESAQQVIEWERDYRMRNHLGLQPPQPFLQLARALSATERSKP